MDIPIKDLETMKTEEDALDQSIALNHIVMTMLESKRREDFWLRLVLIISILVNLVICIIFVQYEDQNIQPEQGSLSDEVESLG